MFMKSDEEKVKIKMMMKKPESMKKKSEAREESTGKKDDKTRIILLFGLLTGVLICKVSMPQDLRKRNTVEESSKPDKLFKDSMEPGPGKDNTRKLNHSVREPVHRTEDLKFLHYDLEAKIFSNPSHAKHKHLENNLAVIEVGLKTPQGECVINLTPLKPGETDCFHKAKNMSCQAADRDMKMETCERS